MVAFADDGGDAGTEQAVANGYWEVTAVEVTRRAGEACCRFAVVLDGPGGALRVEDVPVAAVLDYALFQRVILERAGVLWTHGAVAGRGPEAMALQWHTVLGVLLTYPQPTPDATAN